LDLLLRGLAARRELARTVVVESRCESTHNILRERLEKTPALQLNGLLVTAEEQIAGKGRRRPDWWSGPAGSNLAVSLMMSPPVKPLESLGLHAACAMADAMAPILDPTSSLSLKWPNDILLNGAKVAGILVETSEKKGESYALLGVGVNVLKAPPAEIVPYSTTCLAAHSSQAQLRTRLLGAWLWALEKRLLFARQNGTSQLEKDYLPLLRKWAPHGVLDPATETAGPLVEFSVQRGLTWGYEGSRMTRPLGWISTLEPLPAPTSS
jgi:biotin-[acetyl-CoA-carboxylase] ligase BirA-like protein